MFNANRPGADGADVAGKLTSAPDQIVAALRSPALTLKDYTLYNLWGHAPVAQLDRATVS